MDSYNRGYRPHVNIAQNNTIGTANILKLDALGVTPAIYLTWKQAGFYASAYSWNGETVISFRGTNINQVETLGEFVSLPALNDIFNGWTLGAGFPGGSQAQLAIRFYEAVAGVDSPYYLLADQPSITLLGHSLGGGLAGFVGSLSGNVSWGYDHMPFGVAAYAQAIADSAVAASARTGLSVSDVLATLAQTSVSPISIVINGIALSVFLDAFGQEYALRVPAIGMFGVNVGGEALDYVRDGTAQTAFTAAGSLLGLIGGPVGVGIGLLLAAAGVGEAIVTSQVESLPSMPNQVYQPFLLDSPLGALSPVERHSMPLQVIVIYGREQLPGERPDIINSRWDFGMSYVLPAFFDESVNSIARGLGLLPQGVTGYARPSQQLITQIAYSAIDEGERPFGDTAIRAMSDDAADLGRATSIPNLSRNLGEGAFGIGAVIIEFAGLLAGQHVMRSSTVGAQAMQGVVSYRAAAGNFGETLMIDFRAATWNAYGRTYNSTTRDEVIESLLSADTGNASAALLREAGQFYQRAEGVSLLDSIDRISISLSGNLPPARLTGAGMLLTVLNDNGTQRNFTAGNDFVIGGTGNDILNGLAGTDIIFGGGGNDQLNGGNGRDFLYGGIGLDILRGGAGADELWSGVGMNPLVDQGDTLFGEGGNDLLVFNGGYGTAIGGLGNDGIDTRGAVGPVSVQYSVGDGSDRLFWNSNETALTTVDFTNIALGDVVIRWTVQVISSDINPVRSDLLDQYVTGVFRIYDRAGLLLMDLGEVSGINTIFLSNGRSRDIHFNAPDLIFSNGEFVIVEAFANADFALIVGAVPAASAAILTKYADVLPAVASNDLLVLPANGAPADSHSTLSNISAAFSHAPFEGSAAGPDSWLWRLPHQPGVGEVFV
jgi:RTX calcium-binding nonapeptide repeat (4 copies)